MRRSIETDDPCQSLLEKTYGEVFSSEALRKQLRKCLHEAVFGNGGLKLSHDENNILIVELTERFFNQPAFTPHGSLSNDKIGNFYKILRKLQIEFGNDFMITGFLKPSLTNLNLKLKLPMRKTLKERKQQRNDLVIKDLLTYLQKIWQELLQKLQMYHYYLE